MRRCSINNFGFGGTNAHAINTLAEAEVEAKAYAADVADKVQLRNILKDISHSMPPIRGVIQGAMVLADSLCHRMSYDQWVAATRPKVQGELESSGLK